MVKMILSNHQSLLLISHKVALRNASLYAVDGKTNKIKVSIGGINEIKSP